MANQQLPSAQSLLPFRIRWDVLLVLIGVAFAPLPVDGAQPVMPIAATAAAKASATLDLNRPGPDCCESLAVPRAEDEIWIVNTRDVRSDCDQFTCLTNFHVARFDGKSDWSQSDLPTLLKTQTPDRPTILWVDGNRVSRSDARDRGLQFYQSLVRHAPSDRPIRFVIYSWPSDIIRGRLRDVRVKAQRTVTIAYQLAWVLDQMPPDLRLGLSGYSYGARVITGSMHLLGGGELERFKFEKRSQDNRKRYRALFLAAALDDDWLEPDHFHGRALSQVDRMLLLNNCSDRVLRHYHFLDRCTRPTALGYTGVADLDRLGPLKDRVDQWNVSHLINQAHRLPAYLRHEEITRRAWQYLSYEKLD